MQCAEIKKRLEQYVDNELSPDQRRRVEEHISGCPDCKTELASLLEINKVSDMDFLPDPGKEYWNKLTRDISDKISSSDQKAASAKPLWKKIIWPDYQVVGYAGFAVTAVLLFFLIKTSTFKDGRLIPRDLDVRSMSKTENSLERNEAVIKGNAADRDIGGITVSNISNEKLLSRVKKEVEDKVDSESDTRKQEIKAAETPSLDRDVLRMADAAEEKLPPQTTSDEEKMKASKIVMPETLVITGAHAPPVSGAVMTGGLKNSNNFGKVNGQDDIVTIHGQIAEVQMTPDNRIKEDKDSLSLYITTLTWARKTDDLQKKIGIWENYINTGPDEFSLRRAKFKQMELYFTIACSLKTDTDIEAALKFYEINKPLFKQSNRLKEIETYQAKILQLDKNREGKK